jgi:hypothetical protein
MAIPAPRAAARKALADYLRSALQPTFPQLAVSENWPNPKQPFPPQALTVLAPQNGVQTEYHAPVIWQVTPISGTQATVLYSYGRLTIGMQLDTWSNFEAVRDSLAAAVTPLLNQSPSSSLGLGGLDLQNAPGLVLPLPSYYGVTCEYAFDGEASPDESSDNATVAGWRATWTGSASLYLMAQQTVSLMLEIDAQLTLNGAPTDTVKLAP